MKDEIIRLDNVSIGYKNNELMAKPVNITIRKDDWVGIVGGNGSGKSTLFKTILGLVHPTHGTVKVLDNRPGIYNDYISYMPQEKEVNINENTSAMTLIRATYKGNKLGIPYFNKEFHEKLKHLINLVEVSSYIYQPIKSLSGGQKKKSF